LPTNASRLSLYLASAYTLLAIYGSLYPFSGWRDSGAPLTDFLTAAWPRYYTGFDLAINVAAYVPLGFFWVTALSRRLSYSLALTTALLIGMVLSGSLEAIQHFLPSRVASNVDLACNTLGSLLGALLGVRWGRYVLAQAHLLRWRPRLLAERQGVDSGLILLGLWLLAQLDPTVLAFGTGDLRRALELTTDQEFSPERFRQFETAVAATGALAGLMIASLLAPSHQRRLLPALLLGAVLILKSLSFALMLDPSKAVAWATPGTTTGLLIATVIAFTATRLGVALRRALAALSLLLATAIVNLGPANPYLDYAMHVWNPGQFLNFHGLTQFIALAWPFLAIPWLMLLSKDEQA
jgi:VanZ family protein